MTATVVVDANVAIKFLVEEPGWKIAEQIFAASLTLIAPDAAILEIANALSRKVRLAEIGRDQADAGISSSPRLFAYLAAAQTLAPLAYELSVAYGHPVYDTAYLAMAILENAVLVTSDVKFAARFEDTEHATRFVELEDAVEKLRLAPPP